MQKVWYLSLFLKRVRPSAHASSAMRNMERLQKRLIIDCALCLFPDLTEFRVYFHGSLLFESDYSTRRISVRI